MPDDLGNIVSLNFLRQGRIGYRADVSPEQQIAHVQAWNERRGWGFTAAEFERVRRQNPVPPATASLVLTPHLATAQETAAELWAVAAERQARSWKLDGIRFDPAHLRLMPGTVHVPGLRWMLVRFSAPRLGVRGPRSRNVRSVGRLGAGPEILAAVAQVPEWAQTAQSRFGVRSLVLDGYEARENDDGPWNDVPVLFYNGLQDLLVLNLASAAEVAADGSLTARMVP
ncbi:hypothetical protein Aph01nite_69350 [Acrocarpospora phusangensis]|uniref:Uncharacterized protein n=1 Tax=Acrocarpospora phusangensis TaxID=1070424 RepID=A0A919UUQ1_9ACTN|nr:hypothetical protein [Acrocarpospora phusangensis]GIH28625.1 hypothetical protein Aph01nite_69350 [Acrocarpospora phusangensis]